MKATNRDLLVLVKNEYASDQFMQQEVELINDLLLHYETMNNFCRAHEVFDFNRNKILRKHQQIHQIARQPELKPFQFLCNKN